MYFDIQSKIQNDIAVCVESERKTGSFLRGVIPKSRNAVTPACEQKARAKYASQLSVLENNELQQEQFLQQQIQDTLTNNTPTIIIGALLFILILIILIF